MVSRTSWFKKLNKKCHWPRRFATGGFGPSWRWKRPSLRFSVFVDGVCFHILYFAEAIVLVAGLCCFFLCCGCQI